MFGLCSWIVVGLIVGAIARALFPGRQPMGWIATALLGMAGSLVGGFLSSLIWHGDIHVLHPGGLISSVIGA
ncbi:MAG TPA: GlsB/YeaQ/YmgE family stress response membrane protein, partial [Myxococcaceae bacterium]|nr:GlsB/YeaQ/YmgE family stress response membrane protein [Myxococcaceae bacterium]